MNTEISITLFPEMLDHQHVLVADGRHVHQVLESKQDYTTWIKRRIRQYDFAAGIDYLLHQTVEQLPHLGCLRSVAMDQYLVSLDMAKELAMVEKTPMGKKVRNYFIECERKFIERAILVVDEAEDPVLAVDANALAINLHYADLKGINRQAWADVSGETYGRFHRRREALLQKQRQLRQEANSRLLVPCHRPSWAR